MKTVVTVLREKEAHALGRALENLVNDLYDEEPNGHIISTLAFQELEVNRLQGTAIPIHCLVVVFQYPG